MERHQARLRAHPDERGEGDRDLYPGARRDDARVADRPLVREHQDRHPRPRPREMRQSDVEEHGPTRRLVRPGDQDHGRRNQCHRLPRDEKRQRVACDEDEHLHRDEERRQRPDRAPLPRRRQVAGRVDERGRADRAEHAQEQPRESIDSDSGRERARERLARGPVAEEGPEPARGEQQAAGGLRGDPDGEGPSRDREQPTGADGPDAGEDECREAHASLSSRNMDC